MWLFSRESMPAIAQRLRACRVLMLTDGFEPVVKIAHILGINMDEAVACLRTSSDESAMVICALYDRLNQPLRKSIDIDYLVAAAHCKDVHKIAGLICESYSRIKAIETTMTAAKESPSIMAASANHAKKPRGFNHARMILQTTGVAPVPKNQTTVFIGNRIDQSKNQVVIAPRPEDVSNVVDSVMQELSPPELEEKNIPQVDESRDEEDGEEED